MIEGCPSSSHTKNDQVSIADTSVFYANMYFVDIPKSKVLEIDNSEFKVVPRSETVSLKRKEIVTWVT